MRTHARHQQAVNLSAGGVATRKDDAWEVYHSGGNVSLPREMVKAAEVSSGFALNTMVRKSFHRMMISVFGV